MALKVSKKGEAVVVHLPELFGFAVRNEFRNATTGHPLGTKYVLDFQNVTKMDSSALGMMLLLRETSGGMSADISLINLKPEIDKILHLANFHTLFKLS